MSQATIDKINALDKDVVIEISHLTKDYGKGRGIFDVSFKVPKGCTFFPPVENGSAFLKSQAELLGLEDMTKAEYKEAC